MRLELKERVIMYFDILGYKAMFQSKEFDSQKYLETIKNVMNETLQANAISEEGCDSKVTYLKIFSDNACIIFNTDKDLAVILAKIIAKDLQYTLLNKFQILIRGCITYGEIYLDDVLVYGKGLIRAVDLENKAKYPRIIIDKNIEDLLFDGYGCVNKPTDEWYEIDYLNGHNIDDEEYDMSKIRQTIINLLNRLYEENFDWSVIEKYLWLKNTYNKYNFETPIKHSCYN